MKFTCDECNGSGHISCPGCDGDGTVKGGIDKVRLLSGMPHYDELKELQSDARRVIRQAARLKELNPKYAKNYDEQLKATLDTIECQAEDVVE